ncbi:MAG TPA: hypothetical protein DD727_09140, partial [Clostridiales bacterium]|nr:hypothetical protein [Clostridiales bacterium]
MNRQRGSSSVLVIFMMLMLSVFGTLALMSSHAGLKLAGKHAQWIGKVHTLDARGTETLARIWSAVFQTRQSGTSVQEVLNGGDFPFPLAVSAVQDKLQVDFAVREDTGDSGSTSAGSTSAGSTSAGSTSA